MVNLDIPNDKNFYDYLLQSLTDHHRVLPGYENVTVRLDFTEEFLASYWLQLMKIAEFDNVPKVIIGDHERQGKMLNGFDSVNRSVVEVLEVCESRMDLRLSTKFFFTGKGLADEDQIQLRTAFMLILLFVSEWVAYHKQDGDLRVTLKEPYFQRVYECFNKLFKDIYYGNNENFKSFIFDSNKENSHPTSFPYFASLNRSFNQFNNSLLNITPCDRHKSKRDSLGRFSNANDSLLKPNYLNTTAEEENAADIETLHGTQNIKIMELEKSNIQLLDEKEKLQQNFLKMKNEFEELLSQKEEENQNLVEQNQSLNESVNQLQNQCDSVNEELSSVKEVLTKELNARMKAAEKLLIDKEALQKTLDGKILELDNKEKFYAKVVEEKNIVEQGLLKTERELSFSNNLVVQKEEENQNLVGQIQYINDANSKLQTECDHFVQQLFLVKLEAGSLKERNETLIKQLGVKIKDAEKHLIDKEALQKTLDNKILELENKEKLNSKVVEEKNILEQDLLQENRELTSSNDFVIQKEEENQNLVGQNQLLNESINQLQKQYDSLNDEFSSIKFEAYQLREEKEGLLKLVNTKTENEERIEKEMKDLEKVLDAKILELENNTKFYDKVVEEKKSLEQDLVKTKRELIDSNDLVVQKEEENQNLLGQYQSLNESINQLQKQCDSVNEELSSVKLEANRLREEKEALTKELDVKLKNAEKLLIDKEALQRAVDDKILEMENKEKLYTKVIEEKNIIEQDLFQEKRKLTSSNDFVIQKEEENQNLVKQNQSLNESINQLQNQCDSVNEELSSVKLEANQLREEKEVLTKELNARMEAEEKLKIEKETLQQSLDDKILELENKDKIYADLNDEKRFLQQDLLKTKHELEEANNMITEKEVENKNILNEKQSLSGIISKYEMDQDLCNEELANSITEKERLQEENEELSKVVNRKTRNEERLEEDKQALQDALNAEILKFKETKQLLSNVQSELLATVNQLRGISVMKSEIEAEFDSFRQFFEEFFASLNAKWAVVKNISDDLVAERLHNISISNELEVLKDDLNARERSRTPSLHDEGITGYSSRRTSFNLPTFHGDENMSELMSEQFDNEIRLDSGLGSNEQTPEITPRTDAVPVVQQSFFRRNASTISHWIILFFVILLLFTGHIYLCGALIPPWIYIRVHHDQLPPQ
uniref:Uncharacterized protein n=1 Tax=Panagrolaimus sp. PS1159 TaxID=55785 RepID=A0AC35FNA4_9BILA